MNQEGDRRQRRCLGLGGGHAQPPLCDVARKRRRGRSAQSNASVSVAMSTISLLLLSAQLVQSFVIAPSPIAASTKQSHPFASSKIALTLNAKESEWEWDGEVVEGAHDDEFDTPDANDAFVPSAGFLSMATSVESPALAAASGGGAAASGWDPLKNMGKIHRMELESDSMSEDDLLEMGGDPAFLDDVEDDGFPKGMGDDADFFGWDGTVDEDAHLD